MISLWLMFILNFIGYTTQIWNPYLAPLFFLILIYLVVFTSTKKLDRLTIFRVFLIGILSGLVINFHISFGIGVTLGTLVFLLITTVHNNKSDVFKLTITFFLGLLFTFIPFLLFESRHGFNQIKTAMMTISSAGAVVGQTGLSKNQILLHFFAKFSELLGVPGGFSYMILTLSTLLFLYLIVRKQIKFRDEEKKLLFLLATIFITILTIYLISKNPVWPYHFIGVEMIFLFLIALICKKIPLIKNLLGIWVMILLIINTTTFVKSFYTSSANASLNIEKQVVTTISHDAKEKTYTVFIYNSSIYTYDYSYVFNWLVKKAVPFDPGQIPTDSALVYLVIPADYKRSKDFIQYRTPDTNYKTSNQWTFPDGTMVVKRQKIKE